MSRLRYQSFLILAPLFFLLLNFGLVFGSTLWVENPVPRFTWTAENANSNLTGVALSHAVYGVVYGRSVPSQLVHSNFALNTNSCASCHITHMAPGSRLLFQRSIYNTCSTCHFDATINGYNVLTGFTSGGATAGGGRFFDGDFGAQTDGRRGVSFHVTTGVYEHWQAPGSGFSSPPPADSPWRQPFTCASCHGSHGTFSGRHLHFNVNGQARRFGPVTLVEVSGDVSGAVYEPAPPDNNRTPWLFYDQDSPLFEAHAVRIFNNENPARDVTEAFRVNNRLGRVWLVQPALAGAGPFRISFSQATVVDIEVQYAGTPQERTVYRGGVVNFCTACHTGYLQQREVGSSVYLYVYHERFEHPVGSDINPAVVSGSVYDPPAGFRLELEEHGTERRLVCLSCHFAHGTDVDRMTRHDFTTPAYPVGSTLIPTQTRLLRFGFGSEENREKGNREVCLVCHAATDSRLTNNLTVQFTQPASGSTGATENIVINFDRRVDLASVSLVGETDRVSLSVYGSVYGTVAGSVHLSNDFRTLVFAPLQPLPSQLYTVQVPVPTQSVPEQATILSWFGRRLAEIYSFSFTVP